MRYHSEEPILSIPVFGNVYICDHPVYDRCTLFKWGGVGLAIIQQRYDASCKHTWWTEIDSWIANELYLHPGFPGMFRKFAVAPVEGIFPTLTVRQAMWFLKMKPLKRETWETAFDHKPI